LLPQFFPQHLFFIERLLVAPAQRVHDIGRLHRQFRADGIHLGDGALQLRMHVPQTRAHLRILLLQARQIRLEAVDQRRGLDAGDAFGLAGLHGCFRRAVVRLGLHPERLRLHQILVQAFEAIDHDVLRVLEGDHPVCRHEGVKRRRRFVESYTQLFGLFLEFGDAFVGHAHAPAAVFSQIGRNNGVDDSRGFRR